MRHSLEFKEAAVQKYLGRGNRTVGQVTEELGINIQTIYYWRNQLAKVGGMNKKSTPHSRSSSEKLKLLTEYDALDAEKQGEYLRKNGLHLEHLNAWRKQIEEALSPVKKSFLERNELIAEKKKVEKLQKELRRKDSALAEASALLILKKKADLIWGSGDDE